MRNLHVHRLLEVPDPRLAQGVQAMCVDTDTGRVYFATQQALAAIDTRGEGPRTLEVLHEWEYSAGRVVGMAYMLDQYSLCLAFSEGDVCLYCTNTGSVETVGVVEAGIEAVQWSPDEELMAVMSGKGNLVLMTREFDVVAEVQVHQSGFGECVPVAIGWGKKETQFHGSEGKGAARKVGEAATKVWPWDDLKPRITWRGDGQMFAVGAVCPEMNCRRLRVFSREGHLMYTGEDSSGLEQPLAWRPSGAIVATSQRFPNKHVVAFYEKNGLRHGEFKLRFEPEEATVSDISWSPDSSVMALVCVGLDKKWTKLQLWAVGNYYWYLKQEVELASDEVHLQWSDTTLHLLCHQYMQFGWHWQVDHSNTGIVAVIDGSTVKVTPFNKTVVPPPGSAYEVQLACAVSQVVFAPGLLRVPEQSVEDSGFVESVDPPGNDPNNMAVITCDGRVTFFSIVNNTHVTMGTYAVEGVHGRLYNWAWVMRDTLVCSYSAGLAILEAENIGTETGRLYVKSRVVMPRSVTGVSCPFEGTVAVQTDGGTVHLHNMVDSSSKDVGCSGECWTKMELAKVGSETALFCLGSRQRLYVNGTEIVNGCSSFEVSNGFLVFVTTKNRLHCCQLEETCTGKLQEACASSEASRRIERGSHLVVVIDTRVVLQMPRGNLEVVQPRTLALHGISNLLDSGKHRDAYEIMRRQRINLNLLFDHDPSQFLRQTEEIVKKIDEPTWLSLFLSDLSESDVTETMYSVEYSGRPRPSKPLWNSKIDLVCDATRRALETVNPDKYMLPILTSHVKKAKPELDAALLRIKSLKESAGYSTTPDECLLYLSLLVDVNELYDVALGTYDFDLVLMVAQRSQKDPKEYLPFLNSLKQMEPEYCRYTIDVHIHRYDSALVHISRCKTKFDECLQLVKSYRLYAQAVKLFERGTAEYNAICKAHGEHLRSIGRHCDAGLAFERAGELQAALEAYTAAAEWRQCCIIAEKLGLSLANCQRTYLQLAAKLKSNGRNIDAARLQEEYLKDEEESIACLLEGQAWEEAVRVASKYGRLDLLKTHVDPQVMDRYHSVAEGLQDMKESFLKYADRLIVVREAAEKEMLELAEQNVELVDDIYSDTSSIAGLSDLSGVSRTNSRVSSRTYQSSKSKRKRERKKLSLKEGSPYEDLALMAALHQLVAKADGMKNDVGLLCRALVRIQREAEAESLQGEMELLLKEMVSRKEVIWSSQETQFGPEHTTNAIVDKMRQRNPEASLDFDPAYLRPPKIQDDVDWKLSIFS